MMNRYVLLVGLVVFGLVVFGPLLALAAQPAADDGSREAEALAVLREVDRAARAVRAAEYEIHFHAEGDARLMAPTFTGKYRMRGMRGEGEAWPREFRAELTITPQGDGDNRHLIAGCDGSRYYLIDHEAETVHLGDSAGIFGSVADVVYAGTIIEFVHRSPFTQEIEGRAVESLGNAKIEGEPCVEIRVEYAYAGAHQTTWGFSRVDHLPRRRIDHLALPNGAFAPLVKTLTSLTVDPGFQADAFAVSIPDGYRKSREPAR